MKSYALAIRQPKLIGVSTGRAGTAFTASFLQHHGFKIGHENLFTPSGYIPKPWYDGDISWLAFPYLSQLKSPIFLVSRDPTLVVKSFLQIGFFDPAHKSPYKRYARRFFNFTGNETFDAIRWVTEIFGQSLPKAEYNFRIGHTPEKDLLNFVQSVFDQTVNLDSSFDTKIPKNTKMDVKRNRDIASLEFPASLLNSLLDLTEDLGFDTKAAKELNWN